MRLVLFYFTVLEIHNFFFSEMSQGRILPKYTRGTCMFDSQCLKVYDIIIYCFGTCPLMHFCMCYNIFRRMTRKQGVKGLLGSWTSHGALLGYYPCQSGRWLDFSNCHLICQMCPLKASVCSPNKCIITVPLRYRKCHIAVLYFLKLQFYFLLQFSDHIFLVL